VGAGQIDSPSEPTGQAGALVGASSLFKTLSSDFIMVIDNPAKGKSLKQYFLPAWLLRKLSQCKMLTYAL
jgi:hypothetical protein